MVWVNYIEYILFEEVFSCIFLWLAKVPGQSSMLDATLSALLVILYKILLKTGVSLIFSCPTLEQSFRSTHHPARTFRSLSLSHQKSESLRSYGEGGVAVGGMEGVFGTP